MLSLGFPSVGRALWLSLFDAGERGPVEGRVRLRRPHERNSRERPWRSRLRSAPASQHLHNVQWRQHQFGTAEQHQLIVPSAPCQPTAVAWPKPSAQRSNDAQTVNGSPSIDPKWLFKPFSTISTTINGRQQQRRPSTRKVLFLMQRCCQHATPLLAIIIRNDGRMRRKCRKQKQRSLQSLATSEICLPNQLFDAVVVPATTATTFWWSRIAGHHPIRRQQHGRIAHLKDCQIGGRRTMPSTRSDQNTTDLSCQPSKV